jgi:hypothetical protein
VRLQTSAKCASSRVSILPCTSYRASESAAATPRSMTPHTATQRTAGSLSICAPAPLSALSAYEPPLRSSAAMACSPLRGVTAARA